MKKSFEERLAEEFRILSEARMLRDEDPLTEEIARAIVARFQAELALMQKSQEWAARSLGISGATLSSVLSGTYKGDAEKHIRGIDKWIEQQILRARAPKPAGFVKTGVAAKIYLAARWMQDICGIAIVHGPAGVGKTMTLKALNADTPGSIYFSCASASITRTAILRQFGSLINEAAPTSDVLYHRIVDKLRGYKRLILIDEIHKLAGRRYDEALQTIREIHDETGSPMVWAGMSNIWTYIHNGKNTWEPLDQINTRVKHVVDIRAVMTGEDGGGGELYSIKDIQNLISGMQIRVTPDAIRYLQMVANTFGQGGLRTTLDNYLRSCAAVIKDRPIASADLREMRVEKLGIMLARSLDAQLEARAQAAAG